MTKHTPGPWKVEMKTMVMAGRRSICSAGGYSQNFDTEKVAAENQANARLIAAAPDMLEALEAYIRVWGQPPVDRFSYDSAWEDAWKKARAAINKAKGESWTTK